MENLDKYIPKDYLALKINYIIKQLNELPPVRVHEHKKNGVQVKRILVGSHRYDMNSSNGKKYSNLLNQREDLERQLMVCESIWNNYFKMPPPQYKPHNIIRTINTGGDRLIMDKAFFDSLKNDANTKHPKPMLYPFNGIQYRSAAEREIAMFYTEMGIPFKYEPEVFFNGTAYPQYPDFVFYIKELDTCKFHDHFGMMNYSNYIKEVKIKCSNYINSGLLIDQDVFFTYNTEDSVLDTRYLAAKLNGAIYGTLACENA